MPERLRFGPFDFSPDTLELRRDGRPIRIQEQPSRVLAMLLAARGSIVTRDELRDRLWPPDTFVDFDNGLNTAVNKLRIALGDRAQAPRYIETVGRRGYRMIAPVEAVPESPAQTLHGPATPRAEGAGRVQRPAMAGWLAAVLLLLAFVAALVSRHRTTPAPTGRIGSQVVTALKGAESSPTLSPDGTQVAFVWQGDLYVQPVNVSVGAEVRIAERALAPAWSPDGQWIAFRRRKPDGSSSLVRVTPHGRDEREIGELPAAPGVMGKHGLSWSPDGSQIATAGRSVPGQPPGIILLSMSTGEWTRVTSHKPGTGNHLFPAFSPDGGSIAFVRLLSEQACQEVVIRELATGREEVVTVLKGGTPFDLGWLPDGSALLVSIFQDESLTGLWKIPRHGGEMTPLDPSERASGFSIARLSQRVAYATWQTECNLWETYPDARGEAGRSRPLPGSGRFDWDVQVSPDNRHIAFASLRTRLNQIWVCNRAGLDCRQLTRCESACTTPRWSPDGTQLVYLQHDAGCGAQYTLHAIDLDGRARALRAGHFPSWSRDGRWVYYSTAKTGQREIWRVSADGAADAQVTHGGGGRSYEDADGWFYYINPVERALYRMRTDGTSRELVYPQLPQLEWPLFREKGIFVDRPGPTYRYIDFQTLKFVDALRLPGSVPRCNGFDIAPDGAVIYSRSTSEGDIVLLDPVK
jgi:Tol biopolymer transport system component/DNA-binding winged helix-turn-helix (wHTH) protein